MQDLYSYSNAQTPFEFTLSELFLYAFPTIGEGTISVTVSLTFCQQHLSHVVMLYAAPETCKENLICKSSPTSMHSYSMQYFLKLSCM